MQVVTCTLCNRTVETKWDVVKFTSTLGTRTRVIPGRCWEVGQHNCKEKEHAPSQVPHVQQTYKG